MGASDSPAGTASFDFAGRRVLVTGGSRGIGGAVAAAFARCGADVVCAQRSDRADGADVARGTVTAYPVDLARRDDVARLLDDVLAAGPVDVLVNNAGLQAWHDSAEFPLDEFDRILDVNLRALFQISQRVGARMLERGAGKIVNVASLTSFIGGFRAPAYVASKGAVAQLTKALSNEWAGRGVNVNAVAPGYVDTDLNAPLRRDTDRAAEIGRRIPAGRWGRPEDVADVVLFLASDAARYVHGTVLPVDGGFLAR